MYICWHICIYANIHAYVPAYIHAYIAYMHICWDICIYPHMTSGPFCMTFVPFVNLALVYFWGCYFDNDKWEPAIWRVPILVAMWTDDR